MRTIIVVLYLRFIPTTDALKARIKKNKTIPDFA